MTDPGEVPIRDAATVVLVRDGESGVEAWLLTRVTGMVFAGGMSVFPGGRLDVSDADVPISGDVAAMARRFDCPETEMRALLGAAVRETFEETGVLLTVPPSDLQDLGGDVEAGRMSFGELLRTHDLSVDAGALHPWSRWVTPKGEARRYDTRFFVGPLPAGAQAQDVTSESSIAEWVPARTALDQAEQGVRRFMPPTRLTLAALAEHATVADLLVAAANNSLEAIRPVLRVER